MNSDVTTQDSPDTKADEPFDPFGENVIWTDHNMAVIAQQILPGPDEPIMISNSLKSAAETSGDKRIATFIYPLNRVFPDDEKYMEKLCEKNNIDEKYVEGIFLFLTGDEIKSFENITDEPFLLLSPDRSFYDERHDKPYSDYIVHPIEITDVTTDGVTE